MTASQLEAQRLTSEMAAVKSAYDSNSLHTEYAALQAAAQGSLSSYNGYKSALDSITSTPEYQKLKERLETLQALKDAKEEMDGHASAKEIAKLEKYLGGVKEMKRLPGALFIVDTRKERNAIAEAHKLGIPVVAIADTNCDPDEIDYAIPGNDDAIRAIKLISSIMANAMIEGRQGEQNEEPAETPAAE